MNPLMPSLLPQNPAPSRSYTYNWRAITSLALAIAAPIALALVAGVFPTLLLGNTPGSGLYLPLQVRLWISPITYLIGLVGSVGATVTGWRALGRAYLYPPRGAHRGLAWAGLTLGIIELAILLFGACELLQLGFGLSF